jgi:flagellar FliL protein
MSDANAASESVKADADAAKGGVGLATLIAIMLCTVALVLGAVGGGVYWLSKTGRLGLAGAAPAPIVAAKAAPVKTKMVVFEPLLVNLSDPGGGYLRVVMALQIEDPPPPKDAKPKEEKAPEKGKVVVNEDEVKMRDVSLAVMGRETSERLLSRDGKEELKSELREALSTHLPEVKVVDVLFTEFLVQR